MKNMTLRLIISAATKMTLGIAIILLLLLLPAGTWVYNGAWRFLILLFIPMLIMGILMLIFSPELLRRRLQSKEKRTTQQGVVRYSALIFIFGFVVAGLDFRYGWSSLPDWAVYTASALFIVGYALYGEVMRENVWLSRNITVESKQEVISIGLYGVVRHPMYLATVIMFLSIPFVLGSLWAVIPFVLYIPVIAIRILDEEQLLHKELKGYTEYCAKVRWRLIPFIW